MSQPAGYAFLQQKLKERTGIDLTSYRDRQMIRRLTGYLQRVESPSFYALARRIEQDEEALQDLKDFITINVTEFFRNPERFDELKQTVLPELGATRSALRIWSAGCSSGEEPYSLAILLEELDLPGQHRITGTDIDAVVLERARTGIYTVNQLREVSAARKERFFDELADDRYAVKPALKRHVRFLMHNLLEDSYPERQDLILCRNVVIYFTEEAKERIYRGFAQALTPGGYLLVGGTESILNPAKFGLEAAGPFMYRRADKALL